MAKIKSRLLPGLYWLWTLGDVDGRSRVSNALQKLSQFWTASSIISNHVSYLAYGTQSYAQPQCSVFLGQALGFSF